MGTSDSARLAQVPGIIAGHSQSCSLVTSSLVCRGSGIHQPSRAHLRGTSSAGSSLWSPRHTDLAADCPAGRPPQAPSLGKHRKAGCSKLKGGSRKPGVQVPVQRTVVKSGQGCCSKDSGNRAPRSPWLSRELLQGGLRGLTSWTHPRAGVLLSPSHQVAPW